QQGEPTLGEPLVCLVGEALAVADLLDDFAGHDHVVHPAQSDLADHRRRVLLMALVVPAEQAKQRPVVVGAETPLPAGHAPRAGSVVRVEDMTIAYWQKRYNGARRLNNDGIGLDASSVLTMKK